MIVLGFILVYLLGVYSNVTAQLVDQLVTPPVVDELKCVSGFCLPRGYKKLETPDEGLYKYYEYFLTASAGGCGTKR